MKFAYVDSEELTNQIAKAIRKYLPGSEYRVFFFGSRARGNNFPRSDIDIGIEGPAPVPPETKFNIIDELEHLPTLYTFDVVDFKTVSESFRNEALKYTESL